MQRMSHKTAWRLDSLQLSRTKEKGCIRSLDLDLGMRITRLLRRLRRNCQRSLWHMDRSIVLHSRNLMTSTKPNESFWKMVRFPKFSISTRSKSHRINLESISQKSWILRFTSMFLFLLCNFIKGCSNFLGWQNSSSRSQNRFRHPRIPEICVRNQLKCWKTRTSNGFEQVTKSEWKLFHLMINFLLN